MGEYHFVKKSKHDVIREKCLKAIGKKPRAVTVTVDSFILEFDEPLTADEEALLAKAFPDKQMRKIHKETV